MTCIVVELKNLNSYQQTPGLYYSTFFPVGIWNTCPNRNGACAQAFSQTNFERNSKSHCQMKNGTNPCGLQCRSLSFLPVNLCSPRWAHLHHANTPTLRLSFTSPCDTIFLLLLKNAILLCGRRIYRQQSTPKEASNKNCLHMLKMKN